MLKPIPITLSLIALALLAGGFWWWSEKSVVSEPEVFVNETPVAEEVRVAEPVTVEEEAINLEQEIADLEAAKEKENVIPAEPAETPTPPTETTKTNDDISITNRLMSSGYAAPKSPRKIDTIVLHSSYNSLGGDQYSVEKIVAIYEDYGVSAHYIIDRKGKIYRLVEDKNISYHAGASKMPDGRSGVNDFSIGIELVNTEDDKYTSAQYDAVNNLIDYLDDAHGIEHVVGHSDIAPSRKTDPWNFDWKKLE